MRDYMIRLQQDSLFWLGSHFYKVEVASGQDRNSKAAFVSKCPCCDDRRRVSVTGNDGNNYETECPVCRISFGRGYGSRIVIKDWEVREYIVYKISEAQGPATVSAYKDGIGYIDAISLVAFCKTGRGVDDITETHVPSWEQEVDPDLDAIKIEDVETRQTCDYVFRKKKDAEKLCEMLKNQGRKRLEEFNRTYRTDYEYPF